MAKKNTKVILTPEQQKQVGAAFNATYQYVGHDLFADGGSMSRKDLIETIADYVYRDGMRVVTDERVKKYLQDEMWTDDNLVKHVVASGYFLHKRYGA